MVCLCVRLNLGNYAYRLDLWHSNLGSILQLSDNVLGHDNYLRSNINVIVPLLLLHVLMLKYITGQASEDV